MSKESVILNDCGLNYKEIEKSKAFLIKPNTIRYDIDIVLIVVDSKNEVYQMFLWMDEEIKKEMNFKRLTNIFTNYSYLYILGRKLIDNKHKKNKNDKRN